MKWVTAAVLFDRGRLLICQRPPGDHLAGLWELPGGKLEADETPEACLQRELREELGIEAVIGEEFATSEYVYDRGAISLLAFRVRWRGGTLAPTFHSDVRFASPMELSFYRFAPADIPLIEKLQREWPDSDAA
jgi:8-oxo-dGTP diphosphatase